MNKRKRPQELYQIKGVNALFGDVGASETDRLLPLSQIRLASKQPRSYFDPTAMQELVKSIKQHGILQPLLVRPVGEEIYEVVAGERRYRAAVEASLTEVPVIIRSLDDNEAWQLSLLENLQRENLNPVEETEGILLLLVLKLELTQQEVIELLSAAAHPERATVDNVIHSLKWQELLKVFQSIGKFTPESFRTNRLPLLKLPEELLSTLRHGKIAYTKARAIAQVKDENTRQQLLDEAIKYSLSLSQIKERVVQLVQTSKAQKKYSSLKGRLETILSKAKKTKILENPKQQKRLEKLLAQIESLVSQEE